MEIIKQTDLITPLGVAKLENGTYVFIYDGYAVGSDGKKYYSVTKVVPFYDEEFGFEDEEYINVGWSSELEENIVIK